MYNNLKVCLIGDGVHSKRIQSIFQKKKLNYTIFKPKSKQNYKKENIDHLKKNDVVFIVSPNETHFHYLDKLHKDCFIFCEKPPTNNLIDLKKLLKLNSENIYFNFNFRFSKIAEILKNKNKYNLGKFIYANIIIGHGLALKKEYATNWRSDKSKCPKGVFEMVSIHWIDLLDNIFNITKFNKPSLLSMSEIGNSYDNSHISLRINNKNIADIYSSYTIPLTKKKIFLFNNGLVEQNENLIEIRGPAINLNKNNFFLRPKLLEKFVLDDNKDTSLSLEKSIAFFFKNVKTKQKFSKINNNKILHLNKFIV